MEHILGPRDIVRSVLVARPLSDSVSSVASSSAGVECIVEEVMELVERVEGFVVEGRDRHLAR